MQLLAMISDILVVRPASVYLHGIMLAIASWLKALIIHLVTFFFFLSVLMTAGKLAGLHLRA